MINKKKLSLVVVVTLFLIMSIVGFIMFNSHVDNLNEGIVANNSDYVKSNGIEGMVGSILYIKNSGNDNLNIKRIEIGDVDCNISGNYSGKISKINISSCLSKIPTSTFKIMIITDKGNMQKNIYLKNKNLVSSSFSGPSFITKWNVSIDTGVSGYNNLTLPLQSEGNYNFTVDWGDGITSRVLSWNSSNATHNYENGGVYIVNITGKIKEFSFNSNYNNGDKLIDVLNWGNLIITDFSASRMFYHCKNLKKFSANDILNLSQVTDMWGMFEGASSFNGDLSNWDVSHVTNMASLFYDASSFNGDISNWNVSHVRDMSYMFARASSFNGDISNWDVSHVTRMDDMFEDASSFNGDISNWNVSNVIKMDDMFYYASSFNGDILRSWNISSVENRVEFMYATGSGNKDPWGDFS